jgi:hypothetical protein
MRQGDGLGRLMFNSLQKPPHQKGETGVTHVGTNVSFPFSREPEHKADRSYTPT